MNVDYQYSKIGGTRVNQHINSDLKIIKNIIFENISDKISIFLGGGFGRGEGSVLITESKIQPINDYDIYVITNKKVKSEKIQQIRLKLTNLVKIRQIDLDFKTKKSLRFSKKTVANYDLKYASKFIYGNSNALDEIPTFHADEIILKESIIPMNLFLISLIQSYPTVYSKENIFWGKQQISKAILGCAMALLILEKKYHPSYMVRKNLFKELTNDLEVLDLVKFATDFKINPSVNSDLDWNILWHRSLIFYLKTLKRVYSLNYRKKINNIFDIIRCLKNDNKNRLKKIYGFFKGTKIYKKRENLKIIELLILSYISEINKKNSTNLIDIENEIKKHFLITSVDINKVLNYCIENDENCSIWKSRTNKIFY